MLCSCVLMMDTVPRLVPRRGAGPDLRNSGREIDEYLMRLLHAGAVDASQDVVFHTLVSPCSPSAMLVSTFVGLDCTTYLAQEAHAVIGRCRQS